MSHIDPEKLEEAIEEAERQLFAWPHASWRPTLQLLKEAARAHLAGLPRFKEVDVWHVEYAQGGPCLALYENEGDAHGYAGMLSGITNVSCIRVTGPHKQRVPA